MQVIYPLVRHKAAALQANFKALEVKLDALMRTISVSSSLMAVYVT